MSRASRTPEADDDILDHFTFIGLDSPQSAERFLLQVERTIQFLMESPRLGQQADIPGLESISLRYRHVKGFPNHVIYYRPVDDGIDVVRLLHASRDIPHALRRE